MPKLLNTPFAQDGIRSDIQDATGEFPNSATMQLGFPEVTMMKTSEGGIPPKGSDINGILHTITENTVYQTQGNMYKFDVVYAAKIGGYPLNARLALDNGDVVKSTIPNNTNNPNINMTGWVGDSKITLESISELLSLNSPRNGQLVYVKSYHAGHDEGGDDFIYKTSRQLENDGISIFNGWERQKNGKPWTLEDGGCRRDGTDCAPYFNKVLQLATVSPIGIALKPNGEYLLETDVAKDNVYSISLMGNGATLKVSNPSARDWINMLALTGVSGSCLFIDDIKHDGSLIFDEQTTGQENWMVQALRIWNMSVFIRGLEQTKLIGTLNNFLKCPNVAVDGYIGTLVGGNNSTYGGDSLGDVFYIGEREGVTNYSFKNAKATGVIEETLGSRAFVVVELLFPDQHVDVQTNVTLENIDATDFMRTLHTETAHGAVSYTIHNCSFAGVGVFGLSAGAPDTTVTCTNTKVGFATIGYAGTHTLNWGCNLTMGAGCVVDMTGLAGGSGLIQNTPDKVTRLTGGAKVINIKGLLGVSGNIYADSGVTFSFKESFDDYYFYGSNLFANNCKLINADNTKIKPMSLTNNNFFLDACEIVNLNFARSNFVENTSALKMNTSLTGYNKKLIEARNADIYLNDVLLHKHNEQNEVLGDSPYTSANDLTLEGSYYIEAKALTNVPSGFTAGLIETKLASYLPNFENSLIQVATNFLTLSVKRRTRNYLGIWSAWV